MDPSDTAASDPFRDDGPFDSVSGLQAVADRHGVGLDAVRHLIRALERGHGTMAQFDHPDLGGMGQWFSGGMVMVGRMFDDALKARVDALCTGGRARGAPGRRRVVAGRPRGSGEHRRAERAALRLFPRQTAARRRRGVRDRALRHRRAPHHRRLSGERQPRLHGTGRGRRPRPPAPDRGGGRRAAPSGPGRDPGERRVAYLFAYPVARPFGRAGPVIRGQRSRDHRAAGRPARARRAHRGGIRDQEGGAAGAAVTGARSSDPPSPSRRVRDRQGRGSGLPVPDGLRRCRRGAGRGRARCPRAVRP